MFHVAYVVTHPIQYQAPLLKYLACTNEINVQVFYLSDFSLQQHYEEAFDHKFRFDVGLTEGYEWKVLPQIFGRPSQPSRPWLPMRELISSLRSVKFDAVWVHGWGHLGLVQAVDAARRLGLPVLLRGESTPEPHSQSVLRHHLSARLHRWLFHRVSAFLAIGSRNREYYRQHGVNDERVFSVPYAVDNDYFQSRSMNARGQRENLRQSLSLLPGRPVVLFAAKFIDAKAPDELLAAFKLVCHRAAKNSRPYLLFVGDGPLRRQLEEQARPLDDAVRFLGFRNQSELPALYDLCDLFVLPSSFEPWGLVVNEAMNAARPIIVSDRVGAAADLVENGKNGFVYPSGNVAELAAAMTHTLESANLRDQMGRASRKRIAAWNFSADRAGLLAALNQVTQLNYRQEKAFGG